MLSMAEHEIHSFAERFMKPQKTAIRFVRTAAVFMHALQRTGRTASDLSVCRTGSRFADFLREKELLSREFRERLESLVSSGFHTVEIIDHRRGPFNMEAVAEPLVFIYIQDADRYLAVRAGIFFQHICLLLGIPAPHLAGHQNRTRRSGEKILVITAVNPHHICCFELCCTAGNLVQIFLGKLIFLFFVVHINNLLFTQFIRFTVNLPCVYAAPFIPKSLLSIRKMKTVRRSVLPEGDMCRFGNVTKIMHFLSVI